MECVLCLRDLVVFIFIKLKVTNFEKKVHFYKKKEIQNLWVQANLNSLRKIKVSKANYENNIFYSYPKLIIKTINKFIILYKYLNCNENNLKIK